MAATKPGDNQEPQEATDLADECQITARGGRANYCTSEDCKWAARRLYAEGNFAFKALARAVKKS